MRVVEESTYIYPQTEITSETSGRHHPDALEDTLLFPSIQTQALRARHISTTEPQADFELQLLSMVPNSPSLLMEIYGIPLSLFSLISRATYLANELEAQGAHMSKMTSDQKTSTRIKALENEICSWNLNDAIIVEAGSNTSPEAAAMKTEGREYLILAIFNALILYFYRRVYNTNSLILQGYVHKVLENLEMLDNYRMQSDTRNTSLIWPGFLAAVESSSEESRRRSLEWLRRNGMKSGWKSFASAETIAQELWKIKSSTSPDITWIDLLRGRGTALVLT